MDEWNVRAMSAKQSKYGRKHCPDAVTILIAIYQDVYVGLSRLVFSKFAHIQRVVNSLSC